MIDSAHCLANETLHIALGQVARNLARSLAGGKSLGEELLRSLECVAVFGRLLVGDKVKVEMSPYDLSKGRICYRYKTS
jgi:hypothetical protein